jgi:hypothetical protein
MTLKIPQLKAKQPKEFPNMRNNSQQSIDRLLNMLTYCRPHDSAGEREFVRAFIMPYSPEVFIDPVTLQDIAYVVKVGDTPVLWSCHVDTMHPTQAPVMQDVKYDAGCGMMYKDDKMPLGADDGVGVWLLLEMIDAGVPGTYIFHRGEERGGIGSRSMAANYEEFLARHKWAIAFDRRGTGDIITEQMMGETASVKFAAALADVLNKAKMDYKPCPSGVFTDTANYAHIIPECTNVSVGYDSEHTPAETLDVWHVECLRSALITGFINGVMLPTARVAIDPVPLWYWEKDMPLNKSKKSKRVTSHTPSDAYDVVDMSYEKLIKFVKKRPEDAADLLYHFAEQIVYAETGDEGDTMYDWKNI